MLNNGHKKCEFGEDIVSYIYDEMPAAARGAFEKHLAACHACTSEFAGISDARLSMVEWQREQFAKMPKPEIVIPYPARSEVVGAGFVDSLRGLLSWATIVPLTAALLIALGVGYILFVRPSEPKTVAVETPPIDKPAAATHRPVISTTEVAAVAPKSEPTAKTKLIKAVTVKRAQPLMRSFVAKTVAPRLKLGNDVATTLTPSSRRKAPALSGYEDEDDTSLRLSDIFEELGTKRPD
jgi:anti-sigma factor RsiW